MVAVVSIIGCAHTNKVAHNDKASQELDRAIEVQEMHDRKNDVYGYKVR
jgi:hypothetical protein